MSYDKTMIYLEDYLRELLETYRSGKPLPDLKFLADLLGGYKSGGLKTSSELIKTGPGYFGGILILTDGTNAAIVTVYDNKNELSGKMLWKTKVPGSDEYGCGLFPKPIIFSNGCNVELSGTGASYIVYYR